MHSVALRMLTRARKGKYGSEKSLNPGSESAQESVDEDDDEDDDADGPVTVSPYPATAAMVPPAPKNPLRSRGAGVTALAAGR